MVCILKPCLEYLELMNAVLDGEATPVQHEALSAHLAQCPACAALYEDLKALREGSDALVTKAPETLKANVMSCIAAEAKHDHVVPFAPKAKKKAAKRWRSWAAMAAVFALVIGVGTNQNLLSGGSSAPMPAPSAAAPAAAEPAEEMQDVGDLSRSGEIKEKISAGTGHYEYSATYDVTDPLLDQDTSNTPAEAAPSVGPAEAAVSYAPVSPSTTPLDIAWIKPADLVVQRICGESGYTLETEYVTWLSGRSPYCIFRLLDGETVIDEGTVIYDGLSENGKFYCFSWIWDGQSEEDAQLFRYAVPTDLSYVAWAGETSDPQNFNALLQN